MRVCTNCGRAYSRRDSYCPYCGRTPHRFGRICAKGHPNPHDATFCATCGSQYLSELAPPVTIWRRMLLVLFIMTSVASLWFILPALLSGAVQAISGIMAYLSNILLLGAICFFAPFLITLFLPKHIGKYIRKVLFGLMRYSLRLIWFAITSLWRIGAYLLSSLAGNMGVLHRQRR